MYFFYQLVSWLCTSSVRANWAEISSVRHLPSWQGGTSEPGGRKEPVPGLLPGTSIILDDCKRPSTATVAFRGGAHVAWQPPPRSLPNKLWARICPSPPKKNQPGGISPPKLGVSWGQGEAWGQGAATAPLARGAADIPVSLAAKLNRTGDSRRVAEGPEQAEPSPCQAGAGGCAQQGFGGSCWPGGVPLSPGKREKPENLERTKIKPTKRKSQTEQKRARAAGGAPRDFFNGVYSPFPGG